MTVRFDVDVLGLRVRIELSDDLDHGQQDAVRAAWSGADGSAVRASRSAAYDAVDRTVLMRAGSSFDAAMEALTVDVTLAALDELRGRSLMFHAAGVADAAGRVAAFVGPSGRGKTTLSRELGAHFGYVSDETIAVDVHRGVQPYRKPLSVVRAGAPKQQLSPNDAGLHPLPTEPLTLHALALLDRDASLSSPEILPLSLAQALPELIPQMSYLRDQDLPLQSIAALSDAIGGFRRLRYAEASTVPAVLLDLLDSPSQASEWAPVPVAATNGPYRDDLIVDAIVTDGFAVVMVESIVHVLDGIAPTIWLTARAGGDLDRIVEEVETAFGEPPEGSAREWVTEALDELLAARVLRKAAQ